MKKVCLLLMIILTTGLAGCGKADTKTETKQETVSEVVETEESAEEEIVSDIVKIQLSNEEILVNEEKISEDTEAAVYKANDIIFYLKDQGIQ